MKKFFSVTLTTCLFIILSGFSSLASEKVIETPDVSVVINADQPQMQQKPVNVNGSTLLPLRQLLVNLGVKNDDKHISWNSKEKSIKIVRDSLSIQLKVDSKTAYVNGKAVTLSVPPVVYKNSTYIPTRFVSECLNKKVSWHSASRSVIITDVATFKEVKNILDKTSNTMDSVKKVEAAFSMTVKPTSSQLISMPITVSGNLKADSLKKISYMDFNTSIMGMSLSAEQYLVNNVMYIKTNMSDVWNKKALTNEEISQYDALYKMQTKNTFDDAFCSALKVDKQLSTDSQIVLTGKMVLKPMLEQISNSSSAATSNLKINNMDCKIYINKSTYYINKVVIDMNTQQASGGQSVSAKTTAEIDFVKYNGDFTITLPADAKNAIDTN